MTQSAVISLNANRVRLSKDVVVLPENSDKTIPIVSANGIIANAHPQQLITKTLARPTRTKRLAAAKQGKAEVLALTRTTRDTKRLRLE